MHNFGVMAQVLLNGESRFLSSLLLRFARCPSFKFLTMHSCSLPYIGCGIADRSIRDHHARRQAAPPQRVLTILPPVTALAVGLPAAGYRAAISCVVQVFGCRYDEAIHELWRPAAGKRPRTKARG